MSSASTRTSERDVRLMKPSLPIANGDVAGRAGNDAQPRGEWHVVTIGVLGHAGLELPDVDGRAGSVVDNPDRAGRRRVDRDAVQEPRAGLHLGRGRGVDVGRLESPRDDLGRIRHPAHLQVRPVALWERDFLRRIAERWQPHQQAQHPHTESSTRHYAPPMFDQIGSPGSTKNRTEYFSLSVVQTTYLLRSGRSEERRVG